MGTSSSPAPCRAQTSQPPPHALAAGATPQFLYSPIPRKLLLDLRDSPLAVGIYSLIIRLVTASKAAVPLSGADIIAFDPTLNRGQVLRAINRLLAGHWLIEAQRNGKKPFYLPSWGRIGGEARPWTPDHTHSNGRPRHVDTFKVDRRLLDVCMGRLDLHERQRAVVTRYLKAPIVGLADVGVYALALADLHMGATSPALARLGLLQTNGRPLPLPSDEDILALASQWGMSEDQQALTPQGAARLGVRQQPAEQPVTPARPLFFVAPNQYGTMIGSMIDHLIGDRDHDRSPDVASQSDECGEGIDRQGSHGNSGTHRETQVAAPPPPADAGGGQPSREGRSIWRSAPTARAGQDVTLDTESARLLREIGIKAPALIAQLSQLPTNVVQSAIATARSRPSTRDVAAVVGRMLRDFRDHGTPIPDPVRSPDAAVTPAEMRASFARLGYELYDDGHSLDALGLTAEDLAAAEALLAAGQADNPALGAGKLVSAVEADQPGERAAADPQDLSARLCAELRWSVDRRHRKLLEALTITPLDGVVLLGCPDPAAMRVAQSDLSVLLRTALAALGLPTVIRYTLR